MMLAQFKNLLETTTTSRVVNRPQEMVDPRVAALRKTKRLIR